MIVRKKVNIILNKKNKISTAYIGIPIKAIELMEINSEDSLEIYLENKKIIIKKSDNGQKMIVTKNGNSTLYRITLLTEFLEEMKINKKECNVTLDFSKESIIIKKEEREESVVNETIIISVINFKGGVGKTTTTHSIGAGLTRAGKKVLLIDIDPQGSLTFASLKEQPKYTINDVILSKTNINNVITKTSNFDLIPSHLILNFAESQLHSEYGAERILKKALEKLEERYDYIIIDCPPSMNIFTINALYSSSSVLIPCETEMFALDGLNLLIQMLEQTEEKLDIKIKNTYVLPTKLDKRIKMSKELEEYLKATFKATKTTIKTCSKLKLIAVDKKSIFEIDEKATGAKDYSDLVKEIIEWSI